MSDDKTNRWSVAVPLALLVVGLCALEGCIVLPGNGRTRAGIDPAQIVGGDDDRPLRIGRAVRADVDGKLGDNSTTLASRDGSVKAYRIEVQTKRILFDPLCLAHNPFVDQAISYTGKYLVVQFDNAGVVRGAKLVPSWIAAQKYAGKTLLQGDERLDWSSPAAGGPADPRDDGHTGDRMSFDDKTNRWSVAVPLALLVVGGCALLGCFPIPGNFGNAGGDARPEKKIGKSDSNALIRLGVSDRDRVRDVLGDPQAVSDDGRAWAYAYNVVPAYLVWPLCFGADRIQADRLLALRFDQDGVLRAYRVGTTLKDASRWAGRDLYWVASHEASGGGVSRSVATRPATGAADRAGVGTESGR